MGFDYRITAIIIMILMLILGIAIITGVTSRASHGSEFLGMQLGIG